MLKTILPLCAALFLLPMTAAAAPSASDPVNDEGARIISDDGETRELVIDDGESVSGDLLSAGGANITGAKAIQHAGLITIRKTFTDHLLRLSHDI